MWTRLKDDYGESDPRIVLNINGILSTLGIISIGVRVGSSAAALRGEPAGRFN